MVLNSAISAARRGKLVDAPNPTKIARTWMVVCVHDCRTSMSTVMDGFELKALICVDNATRPSAASFWNVGGVRFELVSDVVGTGIESVEKQEYTEYTGYHGKALWVRLLNSSLGR